MPEVVRLLGRGDAPAVVEDEGRAVVDQPQARGRGAEGGPDHEVGAVHGPVDVHRERVQPDDAPGLPRVHREHLGDLGREVGAARQVVHAEVEPRAGVQQVPHLLVRLGLGERRVEVREHQLRHPQPQLPGQLAHDHLGDQRLAALRGAGELQDVGAEVVGLDDGGHGAAGTQGFDVAGGGDFGEHGASILTRRGVDPPSPPTPRPTRPVPRPVRTPRVPRAGRRPPPGCGWGCRAWRARSPRCAWPRARTRRGPGRSADC